VIELTDKNINMQYKVPQDVQREDTIVGPLTFKQMIILAVGGGIAYALYIQLSVIYFVQIWLPPVLIVSAFTLALAFLKIHNLLFYEFLMHLIEFNLLAKKRFWIKGSANPFVPPYQKKENTKEDEEKNLYVKKDHSKDLTELGRVLDTSGESQLNDIK
jgi:hypothetical protein